MKSRSQAPIFRAWRLVTVRKAAVTMPSPTTDASPGPTTAGSVDIASGTAHGAGTPTGRPGGVTARGWPDDVYHTKHLQPPLHGSRGRSPSRRQSSPGCSGGRDAGEPKARGLAVSGESPLHRPVRRNRRLAPRPGLAGVAAASRCIWRNRGFFIPVPPTRKRRCLSLDSLRAGLRPRTRNAMRSSPFAVARRGPCFHAIGHAFSRSRGRGAGPQSPCSTANFQLSTFNFQRSTSNVQ